MAAVPKDLSIEQGSTFRLSFVYAYDLAGATPYDLTDCTARLQVRAKFGDPVTLLEVSTDLVGTPPAEDGVVLGGATGSIVITITDEKTEALGFLTKPKVGVYDFKVYWPSGDETRLLQGAVTISPAVTWKTTDLVP
jgi:hypothetical protein